MILISYASQSYYTKLNSKLWSAAWESETGSLYVPGSTSHQNREQLGVYLWSHVPLCILVPEPVFGQADWSLSQTGCVFPLTWDTNDEVMLLCVVYLTVTNLKTNTAHPVVCAGSAALIYIFFFLQFQSDSSIQDQQFSGSELNRSFRTNQAEWFGNWDQPKTHTPTMSMENCLQGTTTVIAPPLYHS